tara:strand:- start:223 stop:408 length:186 start_codon:yes stop_codon:yes gene_type:complete
MKNPELTLEMLEKDYYSAKIVAVAAARSAKDHSGIRAAIRALAIVKVAHDKWQTELKRIEK